ncbi:uncharacterized mitochondrial protein-like protein [Tanacetum coccineum]
MRLTSENQANRTYRFNKKLYHAGTKDIINAADSEKRMNMLKTTFVLPIWPSYSSTITLALKTNEKREGPREEEQVFLDELERLKRQENEANEEAESLRKEFAQETENLGAVADFTNLETVMNVSPIPTSRIHSSHPSTLILGDPTSAVQTRSKVNKSSGAYAFVSYVQSKGEIITRTSSYCLFACFLSLNEPRIISEALDDDKLGWMLCKKIAAVFRFRSMGLSDLPYGKSWCDEFEALMKSRFQMSSIGELTFFLGLQVKQKADGIFISQDKYVAEILKKFDFANVKTASTPIETQKPLVKDEEASDVDVHLYRSMIGSLMYLTASRPDIMFAVCACSRFQVTPKSSHLSAGSENFVSDYDGAILIDSTTGGCEFLGRTIISWQCKKQYPLWQLLIEAEYVAAASAVGKFCGFKSC